MTHTVKLTVNGTEREVEVEPRMLLADTLRQQFGLTGTHIGCEQACAGPARCSSTACPPVPACSSRSRCRGGPSRPSSRWRTPTAASTASSRASRPPRPAVRLLHRGHPHVAHGAVPRGAQPRRASGPRPGAGPPLPLHGLPAARRGGAWRSPTGTRRWRGDRRASGPSRRPAAAARARPLRRRHRPARPRAHGRRAQHPAARPHHGHRHERRRGGARRARRLHRRRSPGDQPAVAGAPRPPVAAQDGDPGAAGGEGALRR